ncbi:MAG: hypothetical protein WCR70_04840 [Sphaerochaetaceae bacterium]
MRKWLLSLDPGQTRDPFAIQIWRANPVLLPGALQLGTENRIQLKDDLVMQYKIMDTKYKVVCNFVLELVSREDMRDQYMLLLDATGIGRAVKEEFQDMGIKSMIPIVYTAGGRVNHVYRDTSDRRFNTGSGYSALDFKTLDEIHVPKADMVDCTRLALEQSQIRIAPNVPYADDFKRQMISFTGKMSPNGYTSYNNSSDEIHDEWVNCLMLRSWYRQNFKETFAKATGADKPTEIADIGIRRMRHD